MKIFFVMLLLVEGVVCVHLLKKSNKAYNRLHRRYLFVKHKNDESYKIISDAHETISWKEEELKNAKSEVFILNQRLGEMDKEVEKLKNENLMLSLELQKAMVTDG